MGSRRGLVEPLSKWDPGRIGSYTLLGRLGSGAMGRVYLGRSVSGRWVAVKTIKGEFADEADFRTRFAHEVAAARRVSGVFTAAVVEADPDAEVPWLATAYVPAPSLDQVVRTCGPLPVPAVWWLAAGCAEALASIHKAGLVHRDLKPSNVLVSLDGPRVIDFGVARAVERITLTATRQAVGTPAYMAPEQARDTRQVVAASDVFSLGSTLLFAATGHSPYPGDSVTDVLVRLATEPPDLSGLPEQLADTVNWCLDRDPRERPTPAALLTSLAPGLGYDAGLESGEELEHDFSATPLPSCALALIEQYRQNPRPSPPADQKIGEEKADDLTLGSQTSLSRFHRSPVPSRFVSLWRSLRRGGLGRRDGRAQASAGSFPPDGRWVGRVAWAAVSAVAVGAAAAVLALSGVVGGVDDGASGDRQNLAEREPDLGFGPPPGPPPVPWSGASEEPTGKPRILLNQSSGDGYTVFVVHGRGWTPGRQVTVQLDGGRVSPVRPTADRVGTFNYAINQDHEFFPGKLPPGIHHVMVTASEGGTPARATFRVDSL